VRARGDAVALTVSVGVAVWEGESLDRLLSRADAALYEAKEAGRDRVAFAPPADPPETRFSR
jgi:diguanylate cyclase